MDVALLRNAVAGAFGLATFAASYDLARVPPAPRPEVGARGLGRGAALGRFAVFALVEPTLRWLAALIATVPSKRLRPVLASRLRHAGQPLGLDADELMALCLLFACACLGASRALGAGLATSLAAMAIGFTLPVLQVHEKALARNRDIGRTLPAAIDVMALCMGAGLGFAAALELAAREAIAPNAPLGAELLRVRQAIATGSSRQRALSELAERVPTPTVRDFVSAVVQGERKGTPLREVLAVQARTLRTRRSVLAEEAAARASVLMVLPLLLLLCTVMLLMFGPFIVNGMGL
ncbi:MAG: type II secretion system F family protein [Myxococcales bacterium]